MGWAEALAAISGAMQGGLKAHQWGQEQEEEEANTKLRQEAARRAARLADEDQAMQREDHGRKRATWAQADADRVLEDYGEGASITDPTALGTLAAGGRLGRLDVGQSDFGNLMGGMMTGTVQPSAATVTARRTKEVERQAEQDAKDTEFSQVRSAFENDPRLAPFLPVLEAKRGGVTLNPDDLRTPQELGQRKLAEEQPTIDHRTAATRGNQSHAASLALRNSQSMAATNHELATAQAIARAILGENASERAFQRKQEADQADPDPFGNGAEDADEEGDMPAPSWFGTMVPSWESETPAAAQPSTPGAPGGRALPAAGPGGAAPRPPSAPGGMPTASPTARTPQPTKMSPQEQNLRGQMDRQLRLVKQAQQAGQDTSGLLLTLRALRDQLSAAQGRP